MKIDLQGFGIVEIQRDKYNDFVEYLDLDMDEFLHIVSMSEICIPILSINLNVIESEGPKPVGHIQSKIGLERFNYLIKNEIII